MVVHWGKKKLARKTGNDQRGPERVALAKLMAGRDIEQTNEFLLNSEVWGNSGTSGSLNPKGDYDFTSVILSAILHQFKNDTNILWKKTEEHIALNLLVEEGGKPHTKTPRTMRVMKDTENHILMTNISQYLKNQWLVENGETDAKYSNSENGLEQFLLDNLDELQLTGQFEFNSKPYEGYTISALLILQSYATSSAMKEKVTKTLDNICWEYMQTSYHFRKSAPFRRRMSKAKGTSLTDNPMSSMMKTWYLQQQKGRFKLKEIPGNRHQAHAALIYSYRPPIGIWQMDDEERLVLIGHGHGSSPEIHSRGKGFMLSAGGFQRGEISQIVARPIVLMLDDKAVDMKDCFHISGEGDFTKWNNTGVHHRFGVGEQPVHIPKHFAAVDSIGNWKLYQPSEEVAVMVYSEENFGLIYLPEKGAAFKKLVSLNPAPATGVFNSTKNGQIKFNLNAAKGKWVIQEVNGKVLSTKTDLWPRILINRF